MHFIVSVFAIFLVIGAEDSKDAVKKEMAQLQGEWTMTAGERDGQLLPEELLKDSSRVANGDVTTVTLGGQVIMKAKFALDPSKKPKAIDYTILEGPNKGKMALGIYDISGDTAKFCFAAPGKDRPTEFTAKEGSGRTMSEWKRKAK